jgi:Domain of unknown function (DUF1848)
MRFKGWQKIKIKTDDGEIVDAIAPLIVSASRATDIPAFYSQWFFDRLQKGYLRWVNPFNHMSQFVSFEKTRLVVFWSKNPHRMIRYLPILDTLNIHWMLQYTLNDYEQEHLERNVPSLASRIETFKKLSSIAGPQRVLWRFDPIIINKQISADQILSKIYKIGSEIHSYTSRLTISFLVLYNKVIHSMNRAGMECDGDLSSEIIGKICSGLQCMSREWGIAVYSCAMDHDLDNYEIHHGACIDPHLIHRVFPDDSMLQSFCSTTPDQPELLPLPGVSSDVHPYKDPGQRKACRCIASKDIGAYDTCPHFCTYCYANNSEKIVLANSSRLRLGTDCLLGYR